MASALFKLSSDGGSTYATAGTALADDEALAYNASGSYSIKAALDSTAGVDTVLWSITSADDVNIASLPAVTQNADKTCEFSVTKAGGAWLLRCIVNGGVNALTGKTDPALVRALAIKVLNSVGLQEVAVGESNEAGAYGWTKAHNDVARVASAGGGVVAGGGLTLTGSTLDVVAANSTITVNANSIQANPSNIVTESAVRTAAAALTDTIYFNAVELTDVAAPALATSAATRGFVDGTGSVSVSSSSVSLSEANVATGHVSLTGTLSADSTVTMPTGTRSCVFTNSTSGTYTLKIAGYSSGSCYLAPGQTRRVVHVAGVLRGEALDVLEIRETLSLVGLAGGDTLFSFRLPAMTSLDRCEIAGLVEPDGDGEYRASAGFGSAIGETYSDVVSFDYMPAEGGVRGLSSAEWGSAFTDGYSYGASARTLVFRLNAFNQTVAPTAGKIRIHAVARYLGE